VATALWNRRVGAAGGPHWGGAGAFSQAQLAIAGIAIADAIQIGLGRIAVAQAGYTALKGRSR
jgi:hypothetical protein